MRKIKAYFPLVIIFLSFVLFSPALTNFFSGDDWFHLNISQIGSLREFVNFFSFSPTPQSAAFYRPIPTQVFFFVFHSLFGLNPLPYYLFVLGVFGFSLYLVYLFAKKVSRNEGLARLALFFYAFSVTNFTRIYFLSAFQEIVMVVFVLLACLFYMKNESPKNTLCSILFFVLALGSKETAAVLPLILLLVSWWKKKINFRRLLPFGLILGFYLFFRFSHFGGAVGESYLWDFSPKRAFNTLFWYTLWSFGAPELLVDYVSSGFRILPRFFTDFPVWSYVILGATAITLTDFLLIFAANIKKIDKQSFLAAGWFVLALSPVLFLPWHKFTLELALPMVGFSLFLAQLSLRRSKWASVFIFSFLILNLLANVLTYQTHYSINRSKIARKIYTFLKTRYSTYPSGQYFEFVNDTDTSIKTWGSSKQIAHLSSESNMLRVIFDNRLLNVYYEDYPGERPPKEKRIPLSSKMFLK